MFVNCVPTPSTLQLEREADGRASWQFGKPKPEDEGKAVRVPSFGELRVVDGSLLFRDAILAADLDASFSLTERGTGRHARRLRRCTAGQLVRRRRRQRLRTRRQRPSGLQFSAKGTYRKLPLRRSS